MDRTPWLAHSTCRYGNFQVVHAHILSNALQRERTFD